jgi:prostaglandin-H2 D-isomerase / glutathione transferase
VLILALSAVGLHTQVPVLTVDGETLAQSAAILRYAGKLSCLYPINYIEAAKCDAVLDSIADIGSKLRPSMLEKDEVLQLILSYA